MVPRGSCLQTYVHLWEFSQIVSLKCPVIQTAACVPNIASSFFGEGTFTHVFAVKALWL